MRLVYWPGFPAPGLRSVRIHLYRPRTEKRSLPRRFFDAAVYVCCGLAILLAPPLRALRKWFFPGAPRSLWGGTPIINMAINARAERLLGVRSESIVQETYFITQAFDRDYSRLRAIPVAGHLVPLALFLYACIAADRLHFYCDRGFLPQRERFTFDFRELRVYRRLGIPVLLWTYGADVRSRSACVAAGEPNCCTECDSPGKYCLCYSEQTALYFEQLRSLSVAIFAGVGDMFGFVPQSVDNLYFWPLDLAADGGWRYRPAYPEFRGKRPLRIVHAPNHRLFKGSRFLIQAVEELQREGVAIELVLVEMKPNAEAVEIYRTADLIFDNCLMGSFGYFALEAMALGKPVMCFIRHPERYVLHWEECPVINTHVQTLKEDLRKLSETPEVLAGLGERGRDYVEKYFTLEAFASRLRQSYATYGVR